MGNICSGGNERPKKGALALMGEGHEHDDANHISGSGTSQMLTGGGNGQHLPHGQHLISNHHTSLSNDALSAVDGASSGLIRPDASTVADLQKERERAVALQEEQARVELIVQATGRGMVAVRSTRGSTGYYDQGFAAALSQHLEQTAQFPDHLTSPLPRIRSAVDHVDGVAATEMETASSSMRAYQRLSQPAWEGIVLGPYDGLAGCGGENPLTYFDHIAESFLDQHVPTKERIFGGVGPIVEHLL